MTPTYTSWRGMKRRAKHSPNKCYLHVDMQTSWQKFENFLEDMGERPEGYELDRIDNSKGYSKDNCRWVDSKTQSRNRTSALLLTYGGRTQTLGEWAEELGVPYPSLYARIKQYKWSDERALTQPYRKR